MTWEYIQHINPIKSLKQDRKINGLIDGLIKIQQSDSYCQTKGGRLSLHV